jgi:hypothetical protein
MSGKPGPDPHGQHDRTGRGGAGPDATGSELAGELAGEMAGEPVGEGPAMARAAARLVALSGRGSSGRGSSGSGLPGRGSSGRGLAPVEPVEPAGNAGAPGFAISSTAPPATSLGTPIWPWTPPVSGALAAIFGVASLFKMAWVLAPLAVAMAIVAGLRGHHGWAVIGLASAVVGLAISPWFWTALGLAWLYQMWG